MTEATIQACIKLYCRFYSLALQAGCNSGIKISGREGEQLRLGTRKSWKKIRALLLWIKIDWPLGIKYGLLWDRCVLRQAILCSWGKPHRGRELSADHTLNSWGNKAFPEGLWSAKFCAAQNTLNREHQGFLFLPYNDLWNFINEETVIPRVHLMVTQAAPDASVSLAKCWRPVRLFWKLRSTWEEKVRKYKTALKSL